MQVSVTTDQGRQKLTLVGALDESTRKGFERILPHLGPGDLDLDMGGVTQINSYGARQWVEVVRELSGSRNVAFHRCPEVFMTYQNIVPEFRGAGRIVSFAALYYCNDCDREHSQQIDAAGLTRQSPLPECPCPECARPMTTVDDPADLLAFLG